MSHGSPRFLGSVEEQQRVATARKALIHVANWSLMDEKHRKLQQISDSVTYLRRVCENVRDHPAEAKYRKLRLSNKVFGQHVRDVPGGEDFLHEAGWNVKVFDHEKFWVFNGQPGSVEWAILESACAELDKLWRLVDEKIKRASGDRKAEQQRQLEAIRRQIDEDKAERHAQFQYGSPG